MPNDNITRHKPALSGSFDASEYAGKELFQYDGSAVILDASAGRFDDLLSFLHGYGSKAGQDLGSLATAALNTAGKSGTLGIGLNASDFVAITYTESGFSTSANFATASLGLKVNTAHQTLSGVHTVTADTEWDRGLFDIGSTGISLVVDGSAVSLIPNNGSCTRQSLPVWLNTRTLTNTLEDALPAGSTCYVMPSGQVALELIGSGALPAVSAWAAAGKALWAKLGGDGSEASTNVAGSRHRLVSAGPAHPFLALDRPYVEMRRMTEGRADHVLLADGSVSSASLPPVQGWLLTLRIPGAAMGPTGSREKHLREFWKYADHKLTFFPQWGDGQSAAAGSIETRKHVDASSVVGSAAYTNTVTAEADSPGAHYVKRKGGRLALRRHPNDEQSRAEDYGGRALDVFQDIKIRTLDDPSR